MTRLNNDQLEVAKRDLEGLSVLMENANTFQLPKLAKQAAQLQLKITSELVTREIERHE